MLSAHAVAIAALSEVASAARSELQADFEPQYATGASMEPSTSKNETLPDFHDADSFTVHQPISSNNSQSTVPEPSTPSTSDGVSSQSQESQSQLSQLSSLAATQAPITHEVDTPKPSLYVATNAGQKRTIEGYIKPAGSSSSESPTTGHLEGHSRNTSTTSVVSAALSSRELTSELRTRLSYAMVKVNKGWESFGIEEVESLASQAGSPTSPSSTLNGRHSLSSPRTTMASIQKRSQEGHPYPAPGPPSLSNDPILFTDGQPSRTYESFWREQSQRQVGVSTSVSPSTATNPSLAPSADVSTSTRYAPNVRRSYTPKFTKPPPLHGHNNSDLSQSSQLPERFATPSTPARTSQTTENLLHTPTQKSIQEQDAIETLLFMSSPGNSSTMGHAFPPPHSLPSHLQSPLRTEFGAREHGSQGRRVDFAGVTSNGSGDVGTKVNPRRQNEMRIATRRYGEDEFNHLLDSMADTESSDDEIEIPMTPRRLARGRV